MHSDVTYLAIIFALFTLMFLLVRVCDRIIGVDEDTGDRGAEEPALADDDQVAA